MTADAAPAPLSRGYNPVLETRFRPPCYHPGLQPGARDRARVALGCAAAAAGAVTIGYTVVSAWSAATATTGTKRRGGGNEWAPLVMPGIG